jgi:putative transcriptional regulator
MNGHAEPGEVSAVDVVESGSALVAAPGLRDPNFRRTVVLIIEHQPAGTIGVVLNRPSDVPVRDVLPSWSPHATVPRALYVGGPVQQRAALCVAALPAGVDAELTEGMRVFAGYAGWSQGQLAAEVNRGDWVVVPALAEDVLAPPDTDLWSRILRRQGMPLALLATYPADPTLN